MIETIIAVIVVTLIVGSALTYIIVSKKKGKGCIGCPDSATCSRSKNGCCCCEKDSEENK